MERSSRGTANKGWSFSLGFGRGASKSSGKNWPFYERIQVPRAWTDPLMQPKQWKSNMRFGTLNVKSLCKSGSPTTAARE
jgi:hypothetical protein